MNARTLLFPLFLTGALAGCQAQQSDKPLDTTATPPTPSTPVASEPAPATAAPEAATEATPIPETADAIWQAIDQKTAELKATVASGSLENVHHQAFAIRDLVAALPAKSPTMTPEDQTQLQNAAKFVSTLADRLDESGDAGDRAAAQANFDKMVAVLSGIPRTK